MLINSLKPYLPYNNVQVNKIPSNKKFISFCFINENDNTLNVVKNINFQGNGVKRYLVPTSIAPFRTYMDSEYKINIKENGFIPIKSNINEIGKYAEMSNLFIDINRYFDAIIDRNHLTQLNNKKFIKMMLDYLNIVSKYLGNGVEKVLVYSVNTDNHINETLTSKKIFPIYLSIIKNKNIVLPFDKILFVKYSPSTGEKTYSIIYDKEVKLNIYKFRSIITDVKSTKIETKEKEENFDNELNDLDEDEIKSALQFKENCYSPWVDGINTFYSENAAVGAGLRFIGRGLSYIPRTVGGAMRNRALAKGAQDALQQADNITKGTGAKFFSRQGMKNWMYNTGSKLEQDPMVTTAGLGMGAYFYNPYTIYKDFKGEDTSNQGPSIIQRSQQAAKNLYNKTTPNQRMAAGAVAGAAAVGMGVRALLKRRKDRAQEQYSAQGCAQLTGAKQKDCIDYLNKLRLNNIDGLLQHCQGDQNCMQELQAERQQVMKNIESGTL